MTVEVGVLEAVLLGLLLVTVGLFTYAAGEMRGRRDAERDLAETIDLVALERGDVPENGWLNPRGPR